MKYVNTSQLVCLLVIGLVCVGCSSTARMEYNLHATEPAPELKGLELLVGEWTYEGDQVDVSVQGLPWGPAGKFSGDFSNRFILDGHFMLGKGREKNPSGLMSSLDMFGYDAKTKNYVVRSYLSDGTQYAATSKVDGLTYTSNFAVPTTDGTKVLVKGVWEFSQDRTSFTSTWELSADGGQTWKYYAKYHAKKLKK